MRCGKAEASRCTITDTPAQLCVVIRAEWDWGEVFGFCVALLLLAGSVYGTNTLIFLGAVGTTFLDLVAVLSMGVMQLGLYVAVYGLLWSFGGREVVLLRDGSLLLRRELFGFGREREFDLERVSLLRLDQSPPVFSFSKGTIVFDYEELPSPRTVRFGDRLSPGQAGRIMSAVQQRVWLLKGLRVGEDHLCRASSR